MLAYPSLLACADDESLYQITPVLCPDYLDDSLEMSVQNITIGVTRTQTEHDKNHFRAEFGAVSSCAKFLLSFQGKPF